MVSFTPRSLYPRGRRSWYPLDRSLGGPQTRSEQHGEETILDPYRESNSDPSVFQPVTNRYADCAIPSVLYKFYCFAALLFRLQLFSLFHVYIFLTVSGWVMPDTALRMLFQTNIPESCLLFVERLLLLTCLPIT
jgi:hypothetical protein